MSIIKLCPACEKALLAEIGALPDGKISGYYCGHNRAAAVIVSLAGEVVLSQVTGPCNEEHAQAVMAGAAGELHRAAIAQSAAAAPGAVH